MELHPSKGPQMTNPEFRYGSSPDYGLAYLQLAQRAMAIGWNGEGELPGLCKFVGIPSPFETGKGYGHVEFRQACARGTWEIERRLDICETILEHAKDRRGIILPALRRFRYWLSRLIAPKD